jgi:uncharacterized membrane protein YqiK
MVEGLKDLASAIDSYGPVVVLVAVGIIVNLFFVWRDYRREDRQQRQIEAMQLVHNETVLPLLTDCREAIAASKEVIAQNSQLITGWLNGSRR